jgi:hypothetical protein
VPAVFKSVSFNLLETSGAVQVCKGVALALNVKCYTKNISFNETETQKKMENKESLKLKFNRGRF